MRTEPDQLLSLDPSAIEALATLDKAFQVDYGMSLALVTAAGVIVYPDSGTNGGSTDDELRKLGLEVADMKAGADVRVVGEKVADVVRVANGGDVLGALIGLRSRGTPAVSQTPEPTRLSILRPFAAMTAELSAKEVAIDSLAADLTQRYEELALVYEVANHMEAGQRPERSLDNIFNAALQRLELDIVIMFHQVTKRRKIYCSPENRGGLNREQRKALNRLESCARAVVLSTGQPCVINDLEKDARFPQLRDVYAHALSVPATVSGDEHGVITVIRTRGKERFFTGDVKLISALARQVAIVIKNARSLKEVRSLFLNLVKSLISIVEAKHKYTRGHSERVNKMSCFLGKRLGLKRHARETLHWASLFHDVGKISVPDAILNKPGRLTDEEYEIVKKHPRVGYEVLSHIEQLREAMPGILHHHEKMDGSGYPDGLSGDQIPLGAKIIAVADVYDAVTSARSYRPAMLVDKALDIMHGGNGTHFDPRVLAVFLRRHDEIIEMLNSLTECERAVSAGR